VLPCDFIISSQKYDKKTGGQVFGKKFIVKMRLIFPGACLHALAASFFYKKLKPVPYLRAGFLSQYCNQILTATWD
jgi:hypothetical protein